MSEIALESHVTKEYIVTMRGEKIRLCIGKFNEEDWAVTFKRMLELIEQHGNLDEVARKLEFVEGMYRVYEFEDEVKAILSDYPSIVVSGDLQDAAARIAKLYIKTKPNSKPQPTVGDLKPGDGVRVRAKDIEDESVYIRPESCLDIDTAIDSSEIIMMYEKDNSLCLMLKDTPVEIVKDEGP